jgi:serine/threonine protein kinase
MTPEVPGYAVGHLLGFGAAGEVWLAYDDATGDAVALKRLRVGSDVSARDRIRREAAVLAAIEHPHLVRLRTVVTLADELVLVLDYAPGGSLAALTTARGRLAPAKS